MDSSSFSLHSLLIFNNLNILNLNLKFDIFIMYLRFIIQKDTGNRYLIHDRRYSPTASTSRYSSTVPRPCPLTAGSSIEALLKLWD